MAAAVVQQHAAPLSGYAEITAAFQIVRNVQRINLKWQANILMDTILYEDSELARPLPRTHVGENEILRKNVYYLATKTKNVSDELVLTLVDANVLTVEEGNLILQQPTNKLRAVTLYALLVEKEDPDNSIATIVVSVLQAHENVEVVGIFKERFNITVPTDGIVMANEVDGGGGQEEEEAEEEEEEDAEENNGAQEGNDDDLQDGRWACRFCTFINDADVNICEVCMKTIDFNLNDSLDVNICAQCTLVNSAEAQFCEACEFRFVRQIPDHPENEDNNDRGDEYDSDNE